MSPRLLGLSACLLLATPALAGGVSASNPVTHLRAPIRPQFALLGRFKLLYLVRPDGQRVPVPLPRPQPLDAPLAIPAGDWVELVLVLDGPAWLNPAGGAPVALGLTELVVPIADPQEQARALVLDLPAGPLGGGLAPGAPLDVHVADALLAVELR